MEKIPNWFVEPVKTRHGKPAGFIVEIPVESILEVSGTKIPGIVGRWRVSADPKILTCDDARRIIFEMLSNKIEGN